MFTDTNLGADSRAVLVMIAETAPTTRAELEAALPHIKDVSGRLDSLLHSRYILSYTDGAVHYKLATKGRTYVVKPDNPTPPRSLSKMDGTYTPDRMKARRPQGMKS